MSSKKHKPNHYMQMKKIFTLCLLFCFFMQARAYEWTDNSGMSWTFDISGSNATNLRPTDRDAINGSVVIPAKVYYNWTEYAVTNIASSAFASCTGLYNVVISEGVTEISSGAFYGCPFMGTITIPSSVSRIGYDAFYCNYALTKVIISDIAAWCNINFDDNANPLCYAHHLYINENTEITNLTIPSGVTSIGDYAFHDCTGLTNVNIPSSVTNIGTEAFYGCTNLTNVNVPQSVTSIGEEAFTNTPFFNNKTGLVYLGKVAYKYVGTMPANTNIVINQGTVTLGPSLFSYCSGLKSVTIPESVTNIGERAFESCSGLTSVNVPSSVTEIGDFAFIRCSGLTSVTISENITSIGRSVFNSCSGLTSLTIPESVTSIGMYAFDGCIGLTSLTIPENVTEICEGAFYGCSGLINLTIPGNVNSIGMSAFEECTGMTELTLLEGVANIGKYAFYGCTGLTSVSIPSTATNINDRAFRGCTSLTSVYNYSTTPQTITEKMFSIYEGATLYVPYGTKDVYDNAPYWQDFNVVEMAPTEVTLTISSAGVGTFACPFDLNFAGITGMKAYIASGFNPSTGKLVLTRVDEVPAGTGLYVKGTPGTYTIPVQETSMYLHNMLVGVTESIWLDATIGDNTIFILKNGSHGIGFYTVIPGNFGPNKAYLSIPTWVLSVHAGPIMLEFEDEETTGISEEVIGNSEKSVEVWYTIDGRKLDGKPTQKGVYIVNGKKVILK